MNKKHLLVLGDQLFPLDVLRKESFAPELTTVVMLEDIQLCTRVRHHKLKIALFLTNMRNYREDLVRAGYQVFYSEIPSSREYPEAEDFRAHLSSVLAQVGISEIHTFEIEDHDVDKWVENTCDALSVKVEKHRSPMFLCSRQDFSRYLEGAGKPFMKSFYERERKRQGVLMSDDGYPLGPKRTYSLDSENRKKLPKSCPIPIREAVNSASELRTLQEVSAVVESLFPDHPGSLHWADRLVKDPLFPWPLSRKAALKALDTFLDTRLQFFGDFQDAMSERDPFLFHSLLSTSLNMGLLLPQEVVERACQRLDSSSGQAPVPLNCVEGFVRQVMGWREFVRGMYHSFATKMSSNNHWEHTRSPRLSFLTGETGLPPFDAAVKKAIRTGYCHHIERLMVLANLFNLCEICPRAVYDWFMEHFVDSSDWVMHANVYGMGLMSDGGLFATKPYISGSNYLLKMSDQIQKGAWCETWDGLYWRWLDKNRHGLSRNPRMSMMLASLERMNPERKQALFKAAEQFLSEHTTMKHTGAGVP